jgi:hypothetical protein
LLRLSCRGRWDHWRDEKEGLDWLRDFINLELEAHQGGTRVALGPFLFPDSLLKKGPPRLADLRNKRDARRREDFLKFVITKIGGNSDHADRSGAIRTGFGGKNEGTSPEAWHTEESLCFSKNQSRFGLPPLTSAHLE